MSSISSDLSSDCTRWPYTQLGAPHSILESKGAACRKISELLGRLESNKAKVSFGGEFDLLPAQPGLDVVGVGPVSIPLHREEASRFIGKCVNQRHQVWTLTPKQVQMTNAEWDDGIQELGKVSAEKLGLKDVALKVVLSKLVLYGAGASSDLMEQGGGDNELEVATLVVQLPSEYTGGGLVVLEESQQRHFYDLGRVNGTSAFKPHYAVYTPDASHLFKEVTSGFHLVAEYSLRLPPDLAGIGGKRDRDLFRMELADAMILLEVQIEPEIEARSRYQHNEDDGSGEHTRLAQLFSKSYSKSDIESKGAEALTGMDRDQYRALMDANRLLPSGQQMKFYIASLVYSTLDSNLAWEGKGEIEWVPWYLMSGKEISDVNFIEWTKELCFLNPSGQTVRELCGRGTDSGYQRFAIVFWPGSTDIANTHQLMGEAAAIASVLADKPIDSSKLIELLKYTQWEESAPTSSSPGVYSSIQGPQISLSRNRLDTISSRLNTFELCRHFCNAVAESGDSSLVAVFLKKYFSPLDDTKKIELVSLLAVLVRAFGWELVGVTIEKAIGPLPGNTCIKLALKLADAIRESSSARTTLTLLAVKKARIWIGASPLYLPAPGDIRLLLTQATECRNSEVFLAVEHVFECMNGKHLGPVVDALTKYVNDPSPQQLRATLATVASKRREYLAAEIAELEKPFPWKISADRFPDAAIIETFL